jgi:ribonuclease VapC
MRLPMFEIVPPGRAEMEAAFAAFMSYGKGSGHPATLAKMREVPLLFKGNDFVHTDPVGSRGLQIRLRHISRSPGLSRFWADFHNS